MGVRVSTVAAFSLLGLVLAACGGATVSPSPTSTQPEMPMSPSAMDDIGALGESADAAQADRTVSIDATQELAFEPGAVEVTVGETITFEIENTGTVEHEFVLGSAEFQQRHEEEMQAGEMEMGHEPNEIEVEGGATASLTWRFTAAGTTQFGCHVPGHFPAGMVGTITVSE